GPDGRFDYVYDVVADRAEKGEYSLPRHGGTAYFLAQLCELHPQLRDAAGRAISYLEERSRGKDDRACVGEGSEVDLGTSALALVAAVEYQRNSKDLRFFPWMQQVARFLLFMQKDNGDFRHLYLPEEDRRNEEVR